MTVRNVVAKAHHKFEDAVSLTPETTIQVGDSVSWTSTSGEHTVVSDNVSPFNSLMPPLAGDIDTGSAPYVIQFNTAGKYGYHCDIHGGNPVAKTGMYGIVTVEAARSVK